MHLNVRLSRYVRAAHTSLTREATAWGLAQEALGPEMLQLLQAEVGARPSVPMRVWLPSYLEGLREERQELREACSAMRAEREALLEELVRLRALARA